MGLIIRAINNNYSKYKQDKRIQLERVNKIFALGVIFD
jgi:hypothetical protein